MLPLALAGLTVVLIGIIYAATEKLETARYHKTRKPMPQLQPVPPLRTMPFRTSRNQCIVCGCDDLPLSIDTERCINCHELANG